MCVCMPVCIYVHKYLCICVHIGLFLYVLVSFYVYIDRLYVYTLG
jgi:hypothetical protein